MFGMGFTEILLIAVVAILFLGPDKLPEAMVQIAKFFNSFKKSINEVKMSFEEEIHMKELKEEALSYKREIEGAGADISGFKNAVAEPITQIQDEIGKIGTDYMNSRRFDDDLFADLERAEKSSDTKQSGQKVDSQTTESGEKSAEDMGESARSETSEIENEKNGTEKEARA